MMKKIRELVKSGEPALVSTGLRHLAFYILSAESVSVKRHSALINLLINYRYPEEWLCLEGKESKNIDNIQNSNGIRQMMKAVDDMMALGLSIVTTKEVISPRVYKSLLRQLYLLNVRLIVVMLIVFGRNEISVSQTLYEICCMKPLYANNFQTSFFFFHRFIFFRRIN